MMWGISIEWWILYWEILVVAVAVLYSLEFVNKNLAAGFTRLMQISSKEEND
jgi:hypothetical protein